MGNNVHKILEDYNSIANELESSYISKREEEKLDIIISKEDLKLIILGSSVVDNHLVDDIFYDGKYITVKMSKIK